MATMVRESVIEDVQPSQLAPVSDPKKLERFALVGNPNQMYNVTIQMGPCVSWAGMDGLGPRNGWEIKDDLNDEDRVVVDAKYASYDFRTDGSTVNGLIQGSNEFLDALAKNQPGTAKVAQADLGHMRVVRAVKEIPGKLVGTESMFFGRVDKDLLNAYIAKCVEEALFKREIQEANELAAKKSKSP